MESVGEVQTAEGKGWYRCTRCRHISLITIKVAESSLNSTGEAPGAKPYTPEDSFSIGESIFHTEWNDVGKVLSKIRTSDGSAAIVVSFQKQGQRTLIENLKP